MSHQTKEKSYRLASLGCRTNQYEIAAYRKQLEELGFQEASPETQADICIVNTCTVTQSADAHSRHQIRQLHRQHPKAKIWVTGCLAERDPEGLRSIEGVSAVISNLEKEFLINYMLPDSEVPEFNIEQFDGHTRSFVKVQDGCNSFCSYCIIPYVRGRSRSRSLEDVCQEVKRLIDQGVKEVVLTGINIGDFDGGDGSKRLCDLVSAVDRIEGLERLRLSSIDADEVDQDLQDAIIDGRKTCPSMHIVLQSGSNRILDRMGRKYSRQIFMDTCERLQRAAPNFTFTTDVIVGFPGESTKDFEDTLSVIEEVKFAKVHMFPYSPRPQTKAARFKDLVPSDQIKKRKNLLMRASEKVAYELRERYLGQKMWILTETRDSENPEYISGHTDNFLYVKLQDQKLQANELVEVVLEENSAEGYLAKRVSV